MLLPRLLSPSRSSASTSSSSKFAAPTLRVLDILHTANARTQSQSPTLTFVRHATHQAQGRANGAKDGPGKRLGAKRSGGEYVTTGTILFRQRGTSWFPGAHAAFGRDHCVYALQPGWVRYYRDPALHPKRQYIGVALDKDDRLPYARDAPRKRRLGMVAVARTDEPAVSVSAPAAGGSAVMGGGGLPGVGSAVQVGKKTLRFTRGYAYREANWAIGRAAEVAGVKVKEFVPGDRWTAWRRSAARIKANEERKRLKTAGKKGGKKAKKRA